MKNGLAAAIVDGAEAPKALDPNAAAVGPSEAPDAGGDTAIVAQDMMDAFKAGDTQALVAALDAFKASILAGDTAEDPLKQ